MELVETKTYKIKMAGTERRDLYELVNQLEKIANIFYCKNVYYTVVDTNEEYILDIEEVNNVIEFLQALSEDKVEVY